MGPLSCEGRGVFLVQYIRVYRAKNDRRAQSSSIAPNLADRVTDRRPECGPSCQGCGVSLAFFLARNLEPCCQARNAHMFACSTTL